MSGCEPEPKFGRYWAAVGGVVRLLYMAWRGAGPECGSHTYSILLYVVWISELEKQVIIIMRRHSPITPGDNTKWCRAHSCTVPPANPSRYTNVNY